MGKPGAVTLTINGEANSYDSGSCPESALCLVESLGIDPGKAVLEINGSIVRRADWPVTRLADGDRVEVVGFVGGG